MVVEDKRQAGAEIEVTPEMISAGVSAFDAYLGSADEFFLVEKVYREMQACRTSHTEPEIA